MFNIFKKKPPKEKKVEKEKAVYAKYTTSVTLDTLDLVKRVAHVLDIINQTFYIGYVTYRLIAQMGYLVFNIILLVLTVGDLIFQLATVQEFYTKEQKETRKIVRLVIKWTKRAIRIILITLSIITLVQNAATVTFFDLLMTILMILGFVFSLFSEVVVKAVNTRASLFKNAFYYDIEEFKKGDTFIVKVINKQLKDVLSLVPEVESEEMRLKLEEVHKSQNEKKVRKHRFQLKAAAPKEEVKEVTIISEEEKDKKAKPKKLAPPKEDDNDKIKKLK